MSAAAQTKPPPPKLPARLVEPDGASARDRTQPAGGEIVAPATQGGQDGGAAGRGPCPAELPVAKRSA
eukprot:4950157-Alexandrium_andersonii.AAC.1